MDKLDDVDIKILRLLQKDGRMSYSELSRKIGIPTSTVRFKVNRLLKMGIIKKIMAILDPVKLGYKITLIILLKVDAKKIKSVFETLLKFEGAHHILQITGKYDVVAIFHTRDVEHTNAVINRVKSIEGVLDAETFIATGFIEIKAEISI